LQQNAALGIDKEIMSRILAVLSFSLAFLTLTLFTVFRRRGSPDPKQNSLLNGLSLLSLGMVVGTLPRAIGWQDERVLIGASIASIVATLISVGILVRVRKA